MLDQNQWNELNVGSFKKFYFIFLYMYFKNSLLLVDTGTQIFWPKCFLFESEMTVADT